MMNLRRPLLLVALAVLAPSAARPICISAEGAGGPVLLRGSVVDCRSALPEIEASLNAQREAHERWAQPLRDRLPNADRLGMLQPYDKIVASYLAHVKGVIVTFEIESKLTLPAGGNAAQNSSAAVWMALPQTERRTFFLEVGGSSCDLLGEPWPTVIAPSSVCCDVVPPSRDSCMLELPAASLPPGSLLKAVGGDA